MLPLKVNCLVAQDRHFVIYDLYFDCVYVVRLQDGSDRVSGHVLVTTPPCDHVTVVGDVTPDCPTKGRRSIELFVLHCIYIYGSRVIVNRKLSRVMCRCM